MNSGEKMYDAKIFREKLAEVTHGISGKEIAEAIGEKPATISKWRSENYGTVPTTEQLIKLAKAFKCSIDYLLGIDQSDNILRSSDVCRMLLDIDNKYNLHINLSVEPYKTNGASRVSIDADTDESYRIEYYKRVSMFLQGTTDYPQGLSAVYDFFDAYLKLKEIPEMPKGYFESTVETWLNDTMEKTRFDDEFPV